MDKNMLAKLAVKAAENAYAPYSGFKVGAALLASSGKIYTGCNIENASFSPTVCAERNAFFSAINAGERNFECIAVAGVKNGNISGICTPCGVCRQVMAEFCSENFLVLSVKNNEGTDFEEYTLSDLLPFSFGSDNFTE